MLLSIRIQITIDDDLSATLDSVQAATGKSREAVVNDALRLGLDAIQHIPERKTPFRMRVADPGARTHDNLDNFAEVLAFAEGEDHR